MATTTQVEQASTCKASRMIFIGSMTTLGLLLAVAGFVPLPVLFQMCAYTFATIYVGSHLSLKQGGIDEATGQKLTAETVNRSDALLFPVIGSGVLLSLYVAYKFLNPCWINYLLTLYLTVIGLMAVAETFVSLLIPFCPDYLKDYTRFQFRIPYIPYVYPKPENDTDPNSNLIGVCYLKLISYISALLICILWLTTKHWVLHNIFAIAFCIQAVAIVSVKSFTIAAILLCGLFFYDIFWVFGTDVMVTVAVSFEAPAKIIFPVKFDPWQQSILGLGDVVIPGVLISMCLRFDYFLEHNCTVSDASHVDIHKRFSKFYFWVVMIFYELGLITTGLVMIVFQHPQPALLYLVPFCLFGLFGSAALNGQVKQVLAYNEEEEEVEEKAVTEGKPTKERKSVTEKENVAEEEKVVEEEKKEK